MYFMKKLSLSIFLVVTVLMLAFSARAQIVNAYTPVTGTNYYPVYTAFQITSNQTSMAFQSHTLVMTNINTNEQVFVSYGTVPYGQSPTAANYNQLVGFWTNFPASAGWTNGATWSYTVPSQFYAPAISPAAELCISNSQFASGSCTNPTIFQ
jgi:hypothetical protein